MLPLTKPQMTEENIRELQYKSKEPEESGQKAAMMEEVQDRLSSVEDAVNKQPEWFATYKVRCYAVSCIACGTSPKITQAQSFCM